MKRIRTLLLGGKPCKWLFCGDSITQGAKHTNAHRDYTQLFAEHVRTTLGRGEDAIINMGLSGNTTRDLVEKFDWRVRQFSPDAVFLMFGMNDCDTRKVPLEEFKTNLLWLIREITANDGLPVLQTTNPIVPGQAPSREPAFPEYMAALKEAAEENAVPIIDHTSHWLALQAFPVGWMTDAIHPNAQGHAAIASYLLKQMDETAEARYPLAPAAFHFDGR